MDGSAALRTVAGDLATRVQQPTTLAIVLTLLLILLTTRLLTERRESGANGAWVASTPGYWLPYLGHAPQLAWDTDGFLAGLRAKYPKGIFSLRLLGKVHTIVHQPSLASQLMNKPHSVADEEWLSENLMVSNFGFTPDQRPMLQKTLPELWSHWKTYLLIEDNLLETVNNTAANLKDAIADWVTFNSYPADQTEWEREAEADVVESPSGESFVEADLMELSKNFVSHTTNPSLMGTDFVTNFPEFPSLIWLYDAGFVLMAMKVPSWFPWPSFQRARAARGKALSILYEFNEALDKHLNGEDPGIKWQDMDNVSALVKARAETFRKHNLPMSSRAAYDLSLMWAANANSDPLIFWMLFEICRDPVLLEQIRDEVSPYVQAVQPKNEFGLGVWIAPRIKTLDVDGLINNCPLLKSAYVETMRMYAGVWSIKWMQQDTTLKGNDGPDEAYLLKEGTYAHASEELHHLDPKYFSNPNEWQGTRHVKESVDESGEITRTADLGTIRPYGDGQSRCKDRPYALRELLMYTAVILSMYDIRAPEGKQWEVPKQAKRATTKHPTKKVRVWIKRRELPIEE